VRRDGVRQGGQEVGRQAGVEGDALFLRDRVVDDVRLDAVIAEELAARRVLFRVAVAAHHAGDLMAAGERQQEVE
jgi:hypothetical protein